MKKHLLFILAALFPLLASAQDFENDGIYYNITSEADKTAEVTGYGNYGDITLPATVTYDGVVYSVTSIGNDAFAYCTNLTAITIPESVTSIGGGAFGSCINLTAINIPESVTSIGGGAFGDCTNLTAITLPECVTSIENSAFYNCSSLTSITIPEGVTSIGDYAFQGCSSLTAINIPENSKLTSIGYEVFYDCSSLTAITLPKSMTSIGDYAFQGCSNLTAITIPENVTSIGFCAFDGCSNLTAVHISSIEAWCKISFSYYASTPLYYAQNLYLRGELVTELVIPEGVTSIGWGAFYECSSLTAITIPESVTSIGDEAFGYCSTLTAITCHAVTPPTIGGSYTFSGVDKSIPIYVPAGSVEAYKSAEGWSEFINIASMSVPITHITLGQSSVTLLVEESLTLTATVAPNNATEKALTWSSSNPSVASVDNNGKVTAIVPGTATITVTANDGSGVNAQCDVTVTPASYVITFLIDGEVFLTETLTHGSTINLPDVPEKEGYTFSGWGELPETMPAENVTTSGTFIINKYLVTFKIGDEVIASESLEYGASIVAPKAPEKEGYTFSGWGEIAESVPAYDLTYGGRYSINSYTLTYVVDGEVVLTLPILYGGSIPSLKVPAKEGYTFSGWNEIPTAMPTNDVTIEGTFTQLPSVYLTINQADNGYVKQHLTEGTVCTFTIVAAEGWEIHSMTFNGEEVTDQLTEEDTFTTPELQADAVLNIAYEKSGDNAIEKARTGAIKIQGHQGTLRITGAVKGAAISIYTTDGMLVTQESAEESETELTLPTGQVYIVTVADKMVKIGM